MRFYLIILFFMTASAVVSAQSASDYTFSQYNSGYPPVGGTINTSSLVAGSDENITAAIPIGFTFQYCGVNYTTVKMSPNGFISPGPALNQGAFTNDLAGTIKPVIAPLWDDLMVGTAGSVVYSTTGTSPNRVFTVEFRYMKWWYTATSENRHFQIRLYETSNIVEFYYNIVDAPMGTNTGASIGISDATGGTGHFLSVTPGVNATVSSAVSGNLINSAQYLNGKMYRFEPVSCSSPSSFTATNITHSSAVLSWISPSVTHIKYHTINFNPATQGYPINNVTSPYMASGLLSNTTYYIYLQADCGINGTSSWAGPFTFKTLCQPFAAFPFHEGFNSAVPPNCWTETIVNQVGTAPDWIYTTSGTSPPAMPFEGNGMAYFNSYNCSGGSQARLATQFIDLTAQASPVLSYMMYHDNQFDYTVNEGIQVQVSTNGSSWINEGPLNVRYNLNTGWEMAEVDLSAYSGQHIRIGFLGISQFGNNIFIDDVNLGSPPSCLPVSSVYIGSITNNSAQISWQPVTGAVSYYYELGTAGFTPGTGNELMSGTITDTSLVQTPLVPDFNYSFYIQTNCGLNGMSAWTGPYIFHTQCDPSPAPWTETFQNGGQIPVCWTADHNPLYTGTTNWQMVTTDPSGALSGYNGTGYFARLNTSAALVAGNPYYLHSIPVHIPAPNFKLYYYYWIKSGNNNPSPIVVKISSDFGQTWSTVHSHDHSLCDNWAQQVISLAPYSGQNIMLRFEGYSNQSTTGNLGIDQVEIKAEKSLLYSGKTFREHYSNDGSMRNSIGIKIILETFSSTGILTQGVHYTTTGVPPGLIPELEVLSPDTAVFSLTGFAAAHANVNDFDSVQIEFKNYAFTGGNAASIFHYKHDSIQVDFLDFLVINEADADQAGSDLYEFIELYDGGNGNFSLDGYAVVLYNGSGDVVYKAWDLDGYSTDSNGYFVLGTPAVPGTSLNFAGNTLQNGADAIAIYEGNASEFATGNPLQLQKIQDAVVYGNNHTDDYGLLTLLAPGQPQVNENEYGMGTVYSFQRISNGSGGMQHTYTFTAAPPTPGFENAPAPQLVWPADTFFESLADDGSVETIMTLTLRNDSFEVSGILQENTHFSGMNVPAGLALQLEVTNDTTIEVSMTGNALLHSPYDHVSNLAISLTDDVFRNYTSPLIVRSGRSDLHIEFIWPVHINGNTNSIIYKVYPSPTDGMIIIETTSAETTGYIQIHDVSGRILATVPVTGTITSFDLSAFAPGLYFVNTGNNQARIIKK